MFPPTDPVRPSGEAFPFLPHESRDTQRLQDSEARARSEQRVASKSGSSAGELWLLQTPPHSASKASARWGGWNGVRKCFWRPPEGDVSEVGLAGAPPALRPGRVPLECRTACPGPERPFQPLPPLPSPCPAGPRPGALTHACLHSTDTRGPGDTMPGVSAPAQDGTARRPAVLSVARALSSPRSRRVGRDGKVSQDGTCSVTV